MDDLSVSRVVKWIVICMAIFALLRIVGNVLGWFSQAAQVAAVQFSPQALLTKYEWFKDASAQLDKLDADIRVYDARTKSLSDMYGKAPRSAWMRDDREEWSLSTAEVAGVKATYNGLAAEYNAQMAKFNYAFTNAGQLPKGADRVLPREYRTYEVK